MENMQAYSGSGRFAFVSYAHKDSQKVYPVISRLIEDGYNIWYDGGLPLIEEYPQVIIEKIQNCSVFMIFVSGNAVGSKDVNSELSNAYAKSKPILRINLDDSELPAAWQYFMPPSANYISADSERSIFFSKVEAALSQCRDDRHVTKAKAAHAESSVSGTAAAPVAKTSAKLNKRAFIIPLIICGMCIVADITLYFSFFNSMETSLLYYLSLFLQIISIGALCCSIIESKKYYSQSPMQVEINRSNKVFINISFIVGILSIPLYTISQISVDYLICCGYFTFYEVMTSYFICGMIMLFGLLFAIIAFLKHARSHKLTASVALCTYSLIYCVISFVIDHYMLFSLGGGMIFINGIGGFLIDNGLSEFYFYF